jgi:Lrp/AsnC family transcriptional regulator for asnA, asnC and gidA
VTYALDKLDRRIVEMLQRDGRLPANAIARELGVSERTVRFRIERMVASGLIGIAAWLDMPKFGLPLTATVTVSAQPHRARALAEHFVAQREITYVSLSEPPGGIVLSVVGESGPAIHRYVDAAVRTQSGVLETHTYVEASILKDLASWYPPLDPEDDAQGGPPA